MRKLYFLASMLCAGTAVQAQNSFSDDFESYTVGAYVAQASPNWTTWSNAPGGPEDAQVVTTQASSGANSIYFNSTAANGGPQDLVLPFGGEHSLGSFTYEMDMYVATNKGAYFNFQGETTIGNLWVLDAYFNNLGDYSIAASGSTVISGTYPMNTWFNLRVDINFNTNHWEVFMDNVSVGSFSNANNKIASIDIYPVNQTANGGNGLSEFWVDDVSYTYTPYTLPQVNAAVVGAGALNPATLSPGNMTGYEGQVRPVTALVRNLGVDPITSFDLGYTYLGSNSTSNITGVNIPSLGTYQVEFASPALLLSGTNPLIVTVSNVNGAAADGDPADDVNNSSVTVNAVPAEGKIVLVEEATGTWCQWCPRGAIYMDYMAETYAGVIAGVAIHNGDPMVLENYDGPFSAMVPGYPSIMADRSGAADPLDVEAEFLNRISIQHTAFPVNGAVWNSSTRQLDVSVTYTFQDTANADWRVACVLVEDSVTGTTGYAQSNAYGNNGAGPMGGFELLGTSVPASQMNYNHVARALTPNFLGATVFAGQVLPGEVHTFNFTFVLPVDWDENQMHIIGMLNNPNDITDNVSFTDINTAVTNGFVAGTPIVGIETPAAPDQLVSIFPNPNNGAAWLRINLTEDTDVQVSVIDLQGRKLADANYGIMNGGQILPINTQGLAKGVYMVNVRLNGKSQIQRMVVE